MKIIKITAVLALILGSISGYAQCRAIQDHFYDSTTTELYLYDSSVLSGTAVTSWKVNLYDTSQGIGDLIFSSFNPNPVLKLPYRSWYRLSIKAVDNVNQCVDSMIVIIDCTQGITGLCNADFFETQNATDPYTYLFSSKGAPSGGNQFWSINGKYVGDSSVLSYTFQKNQSNQVCFTVYDTLANDYSLIYPCDSICITIEPKPCFAQMQVAYDSVDYHVVHFETDTVLSPYFIRWDFGEGSAGFNESVSHSYSGDGLYRVTMSILIDTSGTIEVCDSVSKLVIISGDCNPKALYKYDSLDGYTVHFSNTSNGASKYEWVLGNVIEDGDEVSYTFPTISQPYIANIVLITYDSFGVKCGEDALAIAIPGNFISCSAAFDYDYSLPSDSLWVKFNNKSYNPGGSFMWDFGNGKQSSQLSPTHHFDEEGVYDVTLYSFDSSGNICDSTVKQVEAFSDCSVEYTFEQLESAQNTIKFSALNPISTANYWWYFGDGDSAAGSVVTHNYQSPGVKTVSLVLRIAGAPCANVSRQVLVDSNCQAYYTLAKDTNLAYTLFVINESYNLGSNVKYHWDFGDGDTSNAATPIHQYNSFGAYKLCLTVTDDSCSSTYCDSVGLDANGNVLKKGGFQLWVIDQSEFGLVKEEQGFNDFKIYPNPSNGKYTLQFEAYRTGNYKVRVISSLGQSIYEQQFQWTNGLIKANIDLEDQVSGIYYLQIEHDTGIKMVKLIKR